VFFFPAVDLLFLMGWGDVCAFLFLVGVVLVEAS
jgi:hypothetical protein